MAESERDDTLGEGIARPALDDTEACALNSEKAGETGIKADPAPRFLVKWFLAARPFSFTASVMPVIFGTLLAGAVGEASLKPGLFFLAMLAIVALHAASNLFNDVQDYKRGIDRKVFSVSGGVVRGWITPDEALLGAVILCGVGLFIGLLLAIVIGWPILILGLIGIASGAGYSLGRLGLKYCALGDLAVFLNFGLLGSLGAWMVQTRSFSWVPVFWALPIALLVVAILHANNWRDISSDRGGGVKTVAAVLGEDGSFWYYCFLVVAPYVLVFAGMVLSWFDWLSPRLPIAAPLIFGSWPYALELMRCGRNHRLCKDGLEFSALDGATAKLNLLFAGLAATALVFQLFM